MPKRKVVAVPRTAGQPTFEFVSYGRKGPSGARRLSPGQMEQVARTVAKTPEVMVKVSGGARDAGGAQAHFDYIDRHGKLDIETDEGREISGKDAAAELVADWNLDLSKGQYRPKPAPGEKDTRPKVVHNIVLSMPAPTPPEAVLAAAKKFARENFALQYRYAMVLHTDQKHPHVHLVVKAEHEYEPGKRLYVRKATLRAWREQFATHMREQGVAANATPAHLRGQAHTGKKDPIHQRLKSITEYDGLSDEDKAKRAQLKDSTFMRKKVEAVARELQDGALHIEPGKARLVETRKAVVGDWMATAATLRAQGESDLASQVEQFVRGLPGVRTEKERIAAGLLAQVEAQRRRAPVREGGEPPRKRGA
jgi:hypothetical protein